MKQKYTFEDNLIDINQIEEFLGDKVIMWTFSRLLENVYTGNDVLSRRLTEKLVNYEGEENREQIARKVRNWIHNRNLPGNREELFKICFALELDEKRAECLLGVTAENGIHYRNPRELIYAFCLRRHIDYCEARKMVERMWSGPLPTGVMEYREQEKATRLSESSKNMTGFIRNEFKRIMTEAELELFLKDYRACFGIHHNTAYRKFMKMLNYLLFPDYEIPELPAEKIYSVERVVEEYLRMDIPYDKRHGKYSRLQKDIIKHWPTAKAVNDMCSRKADVDRKTLMLLYLATEGMTAGDEAEESGIQEHFRRINLMLSECGMAGLNPHSPFDYLVLQAINKENDEDCMSYRMEWMLHRLFGGRQKPAYISVKGEGLS